MSDFVLAEKLVRRRARLASVFGIMFIVSQASSISRSNAGVFDPDSQGGGHIVAWLVWSGILLLFVVADGGVFRNAAVRSLINDESTREHRQRALVTGFWASLAAAISLYVLQAYTRVEPGIALRLVITVAVAASLMSFGALERRALRDA